MPQQLSRLQRNPSLGYYNRFGGNQSGSPYDSYQAQSFDPEFVGKPVEDHANLAATFEARNKGITDQLDVIDIALANYKVREDDAPLLDEAKGNLKSSLTQLSTENDFNKMEGLLNIAYKDFATNKGLTHAGIAYEQREQYRNGIQEAVGKDGFTMNMADSATRLSDEMSTPVEVDPETGLVKGGFNPYNPAEYVDIASILQDFGTGFESDARSVLNVRRSEPDATGQSQFLIQDTNGSWRGLKDEDLRPYMNTRLRQEPGVMEYLNDRFTLTHNAEDYISEEAFNMAKQDYVDKVLGSYIDSYTNKFAYDQTINEETYQANPAYINASAADKEQEQLYRVQAEQDASVDISRNTEGLLSYIEDGSIMREDLNVAKRTANLVTGSLATAAGSVLGVADESLKDMDGNIFGMTPRTKEDYNKTIETIGKNYLQIDKAYGEYTPEDKELLKQAIGTIGETVKFEHVRSTTPQSLKVAATALFGAAYSTGDGTRPIVTVKGDGQFPGNIEARAVMNYETGEKLTTDDVQELKSNIPKGTELEIKGIYGIDNSFTFLSGDDSFAGGAMKVRIGGTDYIVSEARPMMGRWDTMNNAIYLADRLGHLEGVPHKLENAKEAGLISIDSTIEGQPIFKYTLGPMTFVGASPEELQDNLLNQKYTISE